MKKDYKNLVGKTKEQILEIIGKDLCNDFGSDKWFFYLDYNYFLQKKYQYLLFEDDIVIRSSIIFKNFWEKIFAKENFQIQVEK